MVRLSVLTVWTEGSVPLSTISVSPDDAAPGVEAAVTSLYAPSPTSKKLCVPSVTRWMPVSVSVPSVPSLTCHSVPLTTVMSLAVSAASY